MIRYLPEDFRQKAKWVYGELTSKTLLKAILTDGSGAMILFRLSQTLSALSLGWLAAMVLKLNTLLNRAVIGRRASFGPGFVILHSTGIVINGKVRGGRNIFIEHGVTIGEEKGGVPTLENNIFVGAGAKIFGAIQIEDDVRIGANAVVNKDVPRGATAVGVPARVLPKKEPT